MGPPFMNIHRWGLSTGRAQPSWQGNKGSRPLGIGIASAKGFRVKMRCSLSESEIRNAADYVLSFAYFFLWPSIQLLLLQDPFSFLCPQSFYFSFPTHLHTDRGSFSRCSATCFWTAVRSLSCIAFEVGSAAPGFSNPLEY